jgi:DNA-binding MurR/RpiR family transcriptional regulator
VTEPIVVHVKAVMSALSKTEQRVARQVLESPAAVASWNISTLARECRTSEATVVRFCRAVGLGGYRELRLALATEVGRAESGAVAGRTVSSDIRPGDDLDEVVEKIAFADARAVEETAQQLDLQALHRVIGAIVDAGRIDIYGVGASAFVALDLQQKLHRIGMVPFAWADPHTALTSAALLSPGDVAIGISHSGSTEDTIDSLTQARERGVTTVAVTNFPRSPITRVADHVLTTAARETTFRSGATASRLAQLTVVDCVFVGVAQRTYDSSQRALEATYDAVSARQSRRSSRDSTVNRRS